MVWFSLIHQNYKDLAVDPPRQVYTPKIFGFKVYDNPIVKFSETSKKTSELTYYREEQLKKAAKENSEAEKK